MEAFFIGLSVVGVLALTPLIAALWVMAYLLIRDDLLPKKKKK